jgi:hypothetical protein
MYSVRSCRLTCDVVGEVGFDGQPRSLHSLRVVMLLTPHVPDAPVGPHGMAEGFTVDGWWRHGGAGLVGVELSQREQPRCSRKFYESVTQSGGRVHHYIARTPAGKMLSSRVVYFAWLPNVAWLLSIKCLYTVPDKKKLWTKTSNLCSATS